MKSLAEETCGQRVGRFRGWAGDFKKDKKGNITIVLGILPDDKHNALQFTDELDGEILIIEAYRIAPTPKDDMRDIDRLRAMRQHPARTIVNEDVIDLTGGRVMSHRRIIPWVFVMNQGEWEEWDEHD